MNDKEFFEYLDNLEREKSKSSVKLIAVIDEFREIDNKLEEALSHKETRLIGRIGGIRCIKN